MRKTFLLLAGIALHGSLATAQDIEYRTGNNSWNPDSLGNHRFIVRVPEGSKDVAHVVIPWRRRDMKPEEKRIIVVDAKTGQRVLNVKRGRITRESGELFFEPVSAAGDYYVYYLPYKNEGRSNYPKGVYLKPDTTTSTKWLLTIGWGNQPDSKTIAYESVDAFNSFYPMDFIATAKETEAAVKEQKGFVVFPEDRMFPIRMKYDLPMRWAGKDRQPAFRGSAARGEFYTYQLGIYALQPLNDVSLRFSDLVSGTGKIPATRITCINTNGTTYDAKPFTQKVHVPQGEVQALWCGIQIPVETKPGSYSGQVTVKTQEGGSQTVPVTLEVGEQVVKDGGIAEPWKQTRLQWLNSTLAQENKVIAPYTPLVLQGNSISLLGRKLALNRDGFPARIQTFFTPEMTSIGKTTNNVLAKPVQLVVEDSSGKKMDWQYKPLQFVTKTAGTIAWQTSGTTAALQMDVHASIEFDGFMFYTVKLTATKDVSLQDVRLEIPFSPNASKYMMGLGQKGGYRPEHFDWKWDVAKKNQDGSWIGNVNAGLQYALRDEKYVRPLNTNFYLQKPLLLPSSWGNEGKGGIRIEEGKNEVLVNNYSGTRTMKKGDVLYYNFTLLITPFHPINTDFQWATRFYHSYKPVDTVLAAGATVVNIHHGKDINPWINYPFIEHAKMKRYIDEAHTKGLKVKIYNTVRELSDRAYETFAMRSLGHEIYSTGKGGGFSWLQEHVGDDYIAAWFVPEIKDAAIVNSGMSRWHNYYVEGMNWLVKHVGIDGIYLDDVAFDRITMKRIKRVLTEDGHPGIIDLHSANQYNPSDGFNNSANLYMEHFPYLNRLWFGEYFDYEKNAPEFFLTEVSGIPFGLMGEMLEGGGNPWRGMIYGMTNRMPWSENADPRPIWKVWSDFGITGSQMIGYWSGHCPVKTDHEKILATVYKKKGAALLSIASWADADVDVQLHIDWKALGIDPQKAVLKAPGVQRFQEERVFRMGESIPVKKGQGWLIVIKGND